MPWRLDTPHLVCCCHTAQYNGRYEQGQKVGRCSPGLWPRRIQILVATIVYQPNAEQESRKYDFVASGDD